MPTFWPRALVGRPPSRPPTIEVRPWDTIAPESSRSVDGAQAGGGDVTDNLDGNHGEHDGEGNADLGIKLERVGHNLGKGEDLSGGDAGEVDHAKGNRNDHANDHAKEHRSQLERALAKVGERKDYGKGDKSDAPGLRGAPQRRTHTAGHVLDGRGIQ